jgi:hypothetical protein
MRHFDWSPAGLIRGPDQNNFLLFGQQRCQINLNQTFLRMAHARIFLFLSGLIRCLFSGVEISL